MASRLSRQLTISTQESRRQIDNPLRHYTLDQLDQAARDFAREIHADEELFVKAARIACDPPNWSNVEGITEQEKHALEEETNRGFWGQTKTLRITVVSLVFSAMTQGWVQSVSNGANQTLPEYFGFKYDNPGHAWKNSAAIWKFAGINAITYLSAGVFGCWFSDPLQSSWLGRRGAIFSAACICFMASIGAACATKDEWWGLLIWRCILGLGLGAKASVTPIFGAEVSPSHLRGMLVMNWQLFDALGIFCGFTANLVFYWTGDLAWRFQMASACIPTGALLVLIWTVPESPRWLLKKGRVKDSFAALCSIRHTPLQAAAELFYANAQIQMEIKYLPKRIPPSEDYEMEKTDANVQHLEDVGDLSNPEYYKSVVSKINYWTRILQLFRNGRTRRATVAASVVMIGQQLCGVNVIAFYSTVFFRDINQVSSSGLNALWLSWGLGLANFLFTFPAYWGIDKLGRRFLLLATYPGMILSMLGACLSFLGGTDDERNVRVAVFMFLFIFFYSMGQGPVAFAYSSEVFPLFNREAGMSWAVFVNLFGAGLLTLLVPQAQVSTTSTVAAHGGRPQDQTADTWRHLQAKLLGAFVGFGTLSMLLIYFLVPETRLAATGKGSKRTINYISLEELNHIFKVHTKEFGIFQLTKELPYAVKYSMWILKIRKDKPHLEVMHYWAEQRRDNDDRDANENQSGLKQEGTQNVQQVRHREHDEENINQQRPSQQHDNSPWKGEEQDIRRGDHKLDHNDISLPSPILQSEQPGSLDWDPSLHNPTPLGSPLRVSAVGSQAREAGEAGKSDAIFTGDNDEIKHEDEDEAMHDSVGTEAGVVRGGGFSGFQSPRIQRKPLPS